MSLLFFSFSCCICLELTSAAAGINSNMRRYIGIRGLDIRLTTPLMQMTGMILLVPRPVTDDNDNDKTNMHMHIYGVL